MRGATKEPVSLIVREQIIRSAENILDFIETDQADPAGRWRFRANGDKVHFEKATAANWASYDSALLMGSLGATCFVVASDTKTEVKDFAQLLEHLGYPVRVCDGTDDQVQIQAAIDALPAAGGRVVCLEGNYNLTGAITLSDNTEFIMLGTVQVTGAIQAIENADPSGGNSNIVIRGGVWDGNYTGATGNYVILLDNVDDARIEGVWVKDSYRHSIGIIDCNRIQIVNCKVYNYGDDGIALFGSNDVTISGLTAETGRSATGTSSCIEIEDDAAAPYVGCTKVTITGCVLNNGGIGYGVSIAVNNDTPSTEITITGNTIRNCAMAITVNGGAGSNYAENLAIIGNTLSDSTDTNYGQIYFTGNVRGVTITGNVLESGAMSGVYLYGSNIKNVAVDGNVIANHQGNGVYLRDVIECVISNNIFRNNSLNGAGNYYIVRLRNTSGTVVEGNVATDDQGTHTQTVGVVEDNGADYNTIINNDLRGCITDPLTVIGENSHASSNLGTTMIDEAKVILGKNESGSDLVAGDVVSVKASASGNRFTVPTADGDDKVLGMLTENINDNSWGYVKVLGKTTILKATNANGDIAIGDPLSTEAAGTRARKAAAGDQAFAIALEACAAADCVIDAYIKSPWV